jgi:hypothetical protein
LVEENGEAKWNPNWVRSGEMCARLSHFPTGQGQLGTTETTSFLVASFVQLINISHLILKEESIGLHMCLDLDLSLLANKKIKRHIDCL